LRDPNERDCQQHLAARSAAAFLINKHLSATKLNEPPAEPSLEGEGKTPWFLICGHRFRRFSSLIGFGMKAADATWLWASQRAEHNQHRNDCKLRIGLLFLTKLISTHNRHRQIEQHGGGAPTLPNLSAHNLETYAAVFGAFHVKMSLSVWRRSTSSSTTNRSLRFTLYGAEGERLI